MTNYINDILDLLEGNTPKQKYEYLLKFQNHWREMVKENVRNSIKQNPFLSESEKQGSLEYVEDITKHIKIIN